MYSTDLKTITLEAFEETILTIDLLPSRRVLANWISDLVPALRRMGIDNLDDLRRLLRDKLRHADLAASLGVDEHYLTVLNREVNAYVSKPVPLSKLDVFTDEELERLRSGGMTSSKALYEHGCRVLDRDALATEYRVDEDRLVLAIDLSDLVRINGVGPAFARFLVGLGIRGPHDFNSVELGEVLDRYHQSIAVATTPGPELRLADLEYCRRFSEHLSNDVER